MRPTEGTKLLKWAILNDTHIPKHDKRKLTLWLKIMREWKPDYITINGDFDDFEAPGRWVSGTPAEYTERLAVTTETDSKKLLNEIRDNHPDAEINWLDGNHEVRLEDYINKNAPALVGTVTIPKIFDLDNLGIEYQPYGAPPKKMFGGFYVHHGTFISKNSGESVRKEVDHYGVSMIMGHTHRGGLYHVSDYEGRIRTGIEGYHLCDPKQMTYAPFHNWQAGFVTLYVDGSKAFPFLNQFNGNTVVMDGKKFTA